MYIVHNVFRTKPGKAKELVAKFKAASPHFHELGVKNTRILTDTVSTYWTVVVESEVDDLASYIHNIESMGGNSELRAAMAGYMDLVDSGHRAIYKIE